LIKSKKIQRINLDIYIDKVKKFNKREDYLIDINTARLFLEYCLMSSKTKKIYIIGTGLGGDTKIIKNLKNYKIIGIESRETFQKEASRVYKKFGGELIKKDLGEFMKLSNKLSGIFIFIHSINHIPKKQISLLQKSIKNSFIIIINPNPEIENIVGKTDQSVISYLDSKQIQKLLKSKIVFNFFYNPVKIKGKKILLREAIILKTS